MGFSIVPDPIESSSSLSPIYGTGRDTGETGHETAPSGAGVAAPHTKSLTRPRGRRYSRRHQNARSPDAAARRPGLWVVPTRDVAFSSFRHSGFEANHENPKRGARR